MPIRPTEYASLPGALSGRDIYEVYRADSAAEAATFLASVSIHQQQYYVIVEYPGGVAGKDRLGSYDPSPKWRGDDWTATRYTRPKCQLWKHASDEMIAAADRPGRGGLVLFLVFLLVLVAVWFYRQHHSQHPAATTPPASSQH